MSAPAPARRPRPTPGPRPARPRPEPARRLVVVEDLPAPTPTARPVRGRVLVVVSAALACLLMLALAAVHAQLVSNQVRLDALEGSVAQEQSRYAASRLEVAQLEAPGRIVAEAQGRLGMVAPDGVTYLAPAGDVVGELGPSPAAPEPEVESAERPWASVKPYLGAGG